MMLNIGLTLLRKSTFVLFGLENIQKRKWRYKYDCMIPELRYFELVSMSYL